MDAEFVRMQYLREAWVKAPHDMQIHQLLRAEGTSHQSPYILGLRFPGIEGHYLMLECDQRVWVYPQEVLVSLERMNLMLV